MVSPCGLSARYAVVCPRLVIPTWPTQAGVLLFVLKPAPCLVGSSRHTYFDLGPWLFELLELLPFDLADHPGRGCF